MSVDVLGAEDRRVAETMGVFHSYPGIYAYVCRHGTGRNLGVNDPAPVYTKFTEQGVALIVAMWTEGHCVGTIKLEASPNLKCIAFAFGQPLNPVAFGAVTFGQAYEIGKSIRRLVRRVERIWA